MHRKMQASCSTLCAEWLRERAEWETTELFSPFCQLCALFLFLLVNIVLSLVSPPSLILAPSLFLLSKS